MGGYSLAVELAENQEAGLLAGTIVSSMLGCTLVFSIPVGLSLIEKEDRPYFSRGFLIGLITIPAGSVIGGLAAGFELPMVLRNMVPVILLAAVLALGAEGVSGGHGKRVHDIWTVYYDCHLHRAGCSCL